MNYSIFRFTLNMHNHRSQASVKVFKGDTAVKLIITLTDGGNIYKIGRGCMAMLTGTKADGSKLKHDCIIEGDVIIYIFDEKTTDCSGLATCEITLYDENGRVITAPHFTIDVAEKEVEGSEPISEYSSDAIATVMGAAAKEYGRQEAELARQANEEQRQESYAYAATTADEAKTKSNEAKGISEEAKTKAESAVSTSSEAKQQAESAVSKADSVEQALSNEVDSLVDSIERNYRIFANATLSYNNQTGHLTYEFIGDDGERHEKTVDLPLESSIVSIDEVEQDNKIYLKLTLASGSETFIELDDIFRGLVKETELSERLKSKVDKINNTTSDRYVYMIDKKGAENPVDRIALGMGSGASGVRMPSSGLMLPMYNGGTLCVNDPKLDYQVVNLKTLNKTKDELQAQIQALHPVVMEYISMVPYLQENDATNINLLLQKGKKFHFNGNYRAYNLVEEFDFDYEIADAFSEVNFDWEWTPTSTPSFDGGYCTGEISNFTASLNWAGYTLVRASATRMSALFSHYDNDYGGYNVYVDCNIDIEVVIKDSNGTEYTCTYGFIYWDYYSDYGSNGDGCLRYVESYIEKTSETAHFFPSTLDFRTQSLDRRLTAALEEAIAKRRAEYKAKHNAEE